MARLRYDSTKNKYFYRYARKHGKLMPEAF